MWRDLIYRINDLYHNLNGQPSVYSILKDLNKLEKKKSSEINTIILNKLNAILMSAYKNVPYYKVTIGEKEILPLKNLDELQKMPVLTKEIIRKNFPEKIINSKSKKRAIYNTTSGSTGQPLEFYNDTYANAYRSASFMYFNTLMGVAPRTVHWNLKSVGKYTNRQKFSYWLNGKNLYSVLDVKPENVNQIIEQIEKIRPEYLEGYTASLVKLANFINDSGQKIRHRPKAIIATSETLIESNRKVLEQVFSSHVFNRYGSREFSGAVAQECKLHEGFHVNPLLTFLEIVDDDNEPVSESETGRILITDLNNYVMPFIRYEIGDIGLRGPEVGACGLPFMLISSISGRQGEFIIDKNGGSIPFVTISAYLFRRYYAPYVNTYQFIQEKKGEILLKIVPNDKFTTEIFNEISKSLQRILVDFKTEVKIVDDIPPEKTGKTPFLKKNI